MWDACTWETRYKKSGHIMRAGHVFCGITKKGICYFKEYVEIKFEGRFKCKPRVILHCSHSICEEIFFQWQNVIDAYKTYRISLFMTFSPLLVSMQSLFLQLTSSSVHICLNREVYVCYHGQKKKYHPIWSVSLASKSLSLFKTYFLHTMCSLKIIKV